MVAFFSDMSTISRHWYWWRELLIRNTIKQKIMPCSVINIESMDALAHWHTSLPIWAKDRERHFGKGSQPRLNQWVCCLSLLAWLFLFSMDLKVGCRTIKTTPSFSAFLRTHTRKRREGAKGMVMETKLKKSGPLSDQPIAFPEKKKMRVPLFSHHNDIGACLLFRRSR